ncbi:MAG: carbohydrate kinase family protein [Candidatus Humimicrobiaceae bacterium]
MDKNVILIGDINIDLALKGVKDLSNIKMGAELEISEYNLNIGGSGFNFIKTLSSFGVKVDLYGKIGADVFGQSIKKYLKKEKISNSLITDPEIKTGMTATVPIKNNRFFLTYNGGNEHLNINDLDLKKILRFQHVHLSSYYLLKSLQPDYLTLLKTIKSNKNITISFDTGFDPSENWQSKNIFEILKHIDIFLPSEVEALSLTKSKNIENAINVLSEYCPIVVIKLGNKGLAAKCKKNINDGIVYMKPYDVEVVDTACCGDSCDAGFIYGFLKNYSFENSLDLANGCGSLQASKLGSYKFSGLEEVINFMKIIKKVKI